MVLADISGLVWSEQVPQFGDPHHLNALRRFLTADELEVLVVDPAYMCIPDVDHANLFEVGARLRGVSQVCQGAGATLLLLRIPGVITADKLKPVFPALSGSGPVGQGRTDD